MSPACPGDTPAFASCSSAPVLVFDSGVGGLSVAAEIRRQWPQLSLAYVCDNAALPYGTKPDDWLIPRIVQVCVAAVEASGARALVVACNTASTLALPALREALSIPVIGTVPAIKPAAALARARQSAARREKCEPPVFALLATSATVRRAYTEQLMRDFAADCRVIRVAADPLVAEAERRLRGEPARPEVVAASLADLAAIEALEVVILGCTHFPLLGADISQVLGETRVALVDSGAAIARRVAEVLGLGAAAQAAEQQVAQADQQVAQEAEQQAAQAVQPVPREHLALATDARQPGLATALASQGFAAPQALSFDD